MNRVIEMLDSWSSPVSEPASNEPAFLKTPTEQPGAVVLGTTPASLPPTAEISSTSTDSLVSSKPLVES